MDPVGYETITHMIDELWAWIRNLDSRIEKQIINMARWGSLTTHGKFEEYVSLNSPIGLERRQISGNENSTQYVSNLLLLGKSEKW